jgi:hypothetical protein
LIDSFDQVPVMYQSAYQALVSRTSSFPYTVLAPPLISSRAQKSTGSLLCEIGDTFFVLERAGSQVVVTAFPYHDIFSLEMGNVLLYSWFSIYGKTTTGSEAALTIEFNEATLRHFQPFFNKMRPANTGPDLSAINAELAKFDCLIEENYKYMNFARGCLVPGEIVAQMIYQPRKRQNVISMFGRVLYQRTVFLAHLTIVTNQEVILIGEADHVTEKNRGKYGGVRRYLRLSSLDSVGLEDLPNDLLCLKLQFSQNVEVERLFETSRRQEAVGIQRTIENLRRTPVLAI